MHAATANFFHHCRVKFAIASCRAVFVFQGLHATRRRSVYKCLVSCIAARISLSGRM